MIAKCVSRHPWPGWCDCHAKNRPGESHLKFVRPHRNTNVGLVHSIRVSLHSSQSIVSMVSVAKPCLLLYRHLEIGGVSLAFLKELVNNHTLFLLYVLYLYEQHVGTFFLFYTQTKQWSSILACYRSSGRESNPPLCRMPIASHLHLHFQRHVG